MAMPRSLGSRSVTSSPPISMRPPVAVLEARDKPQQGRFSAAGRADEHDELAIVDGKVDAVDDMDVTKRLAHLPQLQS